MWLLSSSFIFSILILSTNANSSLEAPQLRPHITRANVLMGAGQYHEAVKSFTDALEISPKDYLLYYGRATAYLNLGRHLSALDDFDVVLQSTDGESHWPGAWFSRAKIYAKEGNWGLARKELKQFTNTAGKGNKEAVDLLFGISEGEDAEKKANRARKNRNWDQCVESSTTALETASFSIPIRELRAECSIRSGDIESAVGDYTRLAQLHPSSTTLLLRIAHLSYYMLPPSAQGLAAVKQCLNVDPDHKACRTSFKAFKSFTKELEKLEKVERSQDWKGVLRNLLGYKDQEGLISRFDKALEKALESMSLPQGVDPKASSGLRTRLYKAACKAYSQDKQPKKGKEICQEVLKMDDKDPDALMNQGDIAMSEEEWETAVRAFEQAFEVSGRSSQEIHSRLEKARRLLKQSRQKDYYKVLGVPRNADAKSIKKAYRTAAKEAHPDKGGTEAKMAAVNEAYEVLSNPELRARFDNGDDPNDPESAARNGPFPGGYPGGGQQFFFQQSGHPFGGGNPFGGGQFNFKF